MLPTGRPSCRIPKLLNWNNITLKYQNEHTTDSMQYSGALLIETPVIQQTCYPEAFPGHQIQFYTSSLDNLENSQSGKLLLGTEVSRFMRFHCI